MDETVLRQFFEQLSKRCVFNDFVDKEYAWSQFLKCKIILDNHIGKMEQVYKAGYDDGWFHRKLDFWAYYKPETNEASLSVYEQFPVRAK